MSSMERRNEWTGPASDLHAKLEAEAEKLSINIKRDKTWPKSPGWLRPRMREVLPPLTVIGAEPKPRPPSPPTPSPPPPARPPDEEPRVPWAYGMDFEETELGTRVQALGWIEALRQEGAA